MDQSVTEWLLALSEEYEKKLELQIFKIKLKKNFLKFSPMSLKRLSQNTFQARSTLTHP